MTDKAWSVLMPVKVLAEGKSRLAGLAGPRRAELALAFASDTVTAVLMEGFDPNALRGYCEDKCGVVLGRTIGALAGKGFRIAHMGHINAPMVLGALGVIEVGLRALRVPHGKGGVEAAIAWLGDQVTP